MKTPFFLVIMLWVSNVCFAQSQPAKSRVNILVIIADDMSMNAGIYGDKTISTPGIDGVAKDGVIFDKAYCTASSCTPSRASILTGQYPHQLKEGGNLWGTLPVSYPNYTTILADNGYQLGLEGKGWGPGDFKPGGYKQNPAGPDYKNFEQFINQLQSEKPFCFWIGSHDPHRPYSSELKKTVEFNRSALKVPAWMPDNEIVREDLLDYYAAVKRFDQKVESAVNLLKKKGMYDNTFIIITSDNGMPFPRIKANAYEASTNIPLVMRWGNHFTKGKRFDELVSLVDLAPTILNVANINVPESMMGKTLLPLLEKGKTDKRFNTVFTERERHARVREGNLSYPIRAIRTKDYLYIENLKPDRWPAGDPKSEEATGAFGDIDNGPAKQFLVKNRNNPTYEKEVKWSLEKRPAIELYDLKKDPNQLNNVADNSFYNNIKKELGKRLATWRRQTNDPLLNNENDPFDTYPYYGGKRANQ
jgi:N-sulfoglucosamine sulfohydrolase